MARASKSTARRPAPHADAAPAAAAAAGSAAQGLDQNMALGAQAQAQWARDAMGAWLVHARGLFDMAQTLQQAQLRALQDAANDLETALDELEEAENITAVTAVPGRLLNAHWQHTMDNAGSAAQRLFEIESAWLQQAQAQAAQRMAALASGVAMPGGSAFALPAFPAGSFTAPPAGNGQDAEAAQMPELWRQWFEQWQQGVNQMSRQWGEAVKSAQASSH
jgi:hypothetical protein